jgi:hypothetical protein
VERSAGSEEQRDGNVQNTNSRTSSGGNAAFDVVIQHHQASQKKGKQGAETDGNSTAFRQLDEMDIQIMQYMLSGYSGTDISRNMNKPLSTIQRRSSRLLEKGFMTPVMHLNFKKFGLKRGLLQFTCKGTNLKDATEKIAKIKGVESVGGYLGSVEVVANVVYADSAEVIYIIAEAQKLGIVYDVKWSEEIHSISI